MTLKGLFIRFTLFYISIAVLIGIGFYVLDLKSNSGVNIAALLSAVMWSCMSFANKNQRYFTPEEKKQVVIGMVLIDLAIQLMGVLLVFAAAGAAMPLGIAAIAFLFIGALHAACIYFFVGFSGKQYIKQLERQSKAANQAGGR